MPKGSHLGELEHVVLLATARLGRDAAYGMAIVDEIDRRTGRDVSVGAVYSALDRMERKGLVLSKLGDPAPERGGRPRRFFALRAAGVAALRRSRSALESLWDGLDLDVEGVAP